jgi:hypothetical protein
MADFKKYNIADNAFGRLTGSLTAVATSIPLSSSQNLP